MLEIHLKTFWSHMDPVSQKVYCPAIFAINVHIWFFHIWFFHLFGIRPRLGLDCIRTINNKCLDSIIVIVQELLYTYAICKVSFPLTYFLVNFLDLLRDTRWRAVCILVVVTYLFNQRHFRATAL